MTRSVSLETASSVALIARQLGAVVSNEQIGEEYTREAVEMRLR